jgi:hypothetical protein
MGSQNYRNVGESQPVLIVIDAIISTRNRTPKRHAVQPRLEPMVIMDIMIIRHGV